jgi:hypothetical protein
MRKSALLLLLPLLVQQPGWSCGGHSCGRNNMIHGQFTQRSYRELVQTHNEAMSETQVINLWFKYGYKLESQKKWAQSEQAFNYVLKVVALRDGPGSPASLPILEHLAKVSGEQKNLKEAIGYQETALNMLKAQKTLNQQAILNDQLILANLYAQNQDFANAEDVLKDSTAMYSAKPSLSNQQRRLTYQLYARVLRQLHKDSEADAIEIAAKPNNLKPGSAESKQIIISTNPASR